MRLASFDIEVAKVGINKDKPFLEQGPLGISIAAVAFEPHDSGVKPHVATWESSPGIAAMSTYEAQIVVRELMDAVARGYTILTWNGAAFDFAVLAEESAMYNECARLAMGHIDMMQMVVHKLYYYLGLDKAMIGAGLPSKLHRVTLNDGTILEDMSGAKAPELWAAGERDAVRAYITQDVIGPLALARQIDKSGVIRWTSNRGKPMRETVGMLATVAQLLRAPRPPYGGFPANPASTLQACSWMPKYIIKEFANV